MAQVNTSVTTQTVDDFEEFFGGVDADSSVVTDPPVTTKAEEPLEDWSKLPNEATVPQGTVDEFEEFPTEQGTQEEPALPQTGGAFLKPLIESGDFVPFSDYDETKQTLDEYLASLSNEDLQELYKANLENREQQRVESLTQEFYDSLPEKLKFAAKYYADGGTNDEELFAALAQSERVQKLNPESSPKEIAFQYLKAKGFGTDEEIEDQITEWEDNELLQKKAEQFKPKLEELNEKIIQQKLADQEKVRQKQMETARQYAETVQSQIEGVKDLGGIVIDSNKQKAFLGDFLNASYTTVSGRPTNKLGHLLEKYQYSEPNYALLAEALWLLSDPEGYRTEQRKIGSNAKVSEVARTLKTEAARRPASQNSQQISRPGLQRGPKNNVFRR